MSDTKVEIEYELKNNDTGETKIGGAAKMKRAKELYEAGLKSGRYDQYDEVVFYELIVTKERTDAGIAARNVERGKELERHSL